MFVRKLSPSTRRQFVKWCRHSTATHWRSCWLVWSGLNRNGLILFDEIYRRNENWNGKRKITCYTLVVCEWTGGRASEWACESVFQVSVCAHESTKIKKKLKPIKIILRIELRMSEMYWTNERTNKWMNERRSTETT